MVDKNRLAELAKLIRYYILEMTTGAGSGHATSALSATDIMTDLFFDKLRFDLNNPKNPSNDRVIFSKGHASPLLYALWGAAGVLSEEELLKYRQFGSPLEGHPVPNFKYVDAATGSLGQGLSVGVGMALAAKIDELPYITYVLMGDSEVAEGSVWEAMEVAAHYKLGNLVGIIDVNRLGQSTETMLGWDAETYRRRVLAFGWKAFVIDGHDMDEITKTFAEIDGSGDQPVMIIAKTIKGKGVSFLEDKEGWHGKVLPREEYEKAIKELGKIDESARGEIAKPDEVKVKSQSVKSSDYQLPTTDYKIGDMVATRTGYGNGLVRIFPNHPNMVVLDGETSNSTYSEIFKKEHPDRYFEMYIAEQNMVGTALGLSKRGYVPFVSTFSAFFTRAHDQIRMSAYSQAYIKFVGSHAGVSIGEDGPSQMGLEDFALFRAVFGSHVLCPSDAVSCEKLVEVAADEDGLFYIRTARPATPVIYEPGEEFKVGGSKVLKSSKKDQLVIVACGVCVVEAIKAAEELEKSGINVRVIDAYSIKPIDEETLRKSVNEAGGKIVTVEDHYLEGGLGDAVLNVFADGGCKIHKLAVSKMPMSGKGDELLAYEGISASAIINKVRKILK